MMTQQDAIFPKLAFSVGVAGHRYSHPSLAENEDIITAQITDVFGQINQSCLDYLKTNRDIHTPNRASEISLLSGLAEGVDQIAVRNKPDNWVLRAVLPFPTKRFQKDFHPNLSGDGKDHLDGFNEAMEVAGEKVIEFPVLDRDDPITNYATSGTFLLRQIDILVAVWDGQETKLRAGTFALIKVALQNDIPVVWINPTENGKIQVLTYEGQWRELNCVSGKATPDSNIHDIVASLIGMPTSEEVGTSEHDEVPEISARGSFLEFTKETVNKCCYWSFFDFWKRSVNGKWPRLCIPASIETDHKPAWDLFIPSPLGGTSSDEENHAPLYERIEKVLLPRYMQADNLAQKYANMYRSTYFFVYSLSVLAVFVALAGLFPWGATTPAEFLWNKLIIVITELSLIGAILALVSKGSSGRWHDRFIQYRVLAENLRYLRFLLPFGSAGTTRLRIPLFSESTSWIHWYIRATIREIGIPAIEYTLKQQQAILQATIDGEIKGQIKYFRRNAEENQRINHFLHMFGNWCFIVTFIVLTLFMAAYIGDAVVRAISEGTIAHAAGAVISEGGREASSFADKLYKLKIYVTAISAGLPALGAGLSGIRFTGDFEGISKSSFRTAAELEFLEGKISKHITRLQCEDDSSDLLERTNQLLLETAKVLSDDLGFWQRLFGSKKLILPG